LGGMRAQVKGKSLNEEEKEKGGHRTERRGVGEGVGERKGEWGEKERRGEGRDGEG